MEYLAELLQQKLSNYSQEELEARFAQYEQFDACGPYVEEFLQYHEEYYSISIRKSQALNMDVFESDNYSLAA